MHFFSVSKERQECQWAMEKKFPKGSKIILEVTVERAGVCDPFPTEYIICRTKDGKEFIAKTQDILNLD